MGLLWPTICCRAECVSPIPIIVCTHPAKKYRGLEEDNLLCPIFFLPDFVSQLKTHRTLWTPTSFLSFGQILTEELPCQQSIWKGKVLFPVVSSKMLTNFWETLLHSLTGPVVQRAQSPWHQSLRKASMLVLEP